MMGRNNRQLPYRKISGYGGSVHIGTRIRQLRLDRGLSLTELAEKAGVAKSYLSNIERQVQYNPSMLFLQKLSRVFGVEVESLVAVMDSQPSLDPEWVGLVKEAAEWGVTKEEFRTFIDYIKFQNWTRAKDSHI
jgi:XRE family transcriptional regulator, master regulator for biofilm formation